jgi:hypothetical protein
MSSLFNVVAERALVGGDGSVPKSPAIIWHIPPLKEWAVLDETLTPGSEGKVDKGDQLAIPII